MDSPSFTLQTVSAPRRALATDMHSVVPPNYLRMPLQELRTCVLQLRDATAEDACPPDVAYEYLLAGVILEYRDIARRRSANGF